MNSEKFLANFGHIANAPGGVERLRDLVLQLAVTGVLVRQQANEGDADALIAEAARSRDRMVAAGLLKPRILSPEVDSSSQAQSIPAQWRWVRLGNLVSKLGSGSTPRGGSKVYTAKGIPFLRSQNVWNDGIRLDDVVFIDPKTHAEMGGTHVAANDVLLNITGASLGRCAVVPKDFTSANVSQHVTIIRPLVADTRHFLRICLLSPFGQAMIWGRQVGMAREGLSKKVLEQFEIPLPPLSEQIRIMAKVDELMALCDRLEAQQQERERTFPIFSRTAHALFAEAPTPANLNRIFDEISDVSPDDLRRTILNLAIRGKLVPQKPDEPPAEQLLTEITQSLSPENVKRQGPPLPRIHKEQLEFEIPKSWTWARFRDVALIASNLVSPSDFLDFKHLAPDNIEKGNGVLLPCKSVRDDNVTSANHRFHKGQIIYSKIRPNLSKVVVVDFDGLCSADMYPIDALIDAHYLQRYMLSE